MRGEEGLIHCGNILECRDDSCITNVNDGGDATLLIHEGVKGWEVSIIGDHRRPSLCRRWETERRLPHLAVTSIGAATDFGVTAAAKSEHHDELQ
ncbi:Hypothetical predicted protein [Olea europaea subsp. europaea]|uniref:Uncharacterized protein n=1 Tax=Olea europaea subsp. europaea TaxID=158383 RepID=A0A8S0QV72_OLEEU|nr:Hypothetical predicted protein [Olea europaea subsp. europaea]